MEEHRLEKLAKIEERGLDPYGARFLRDVSAAELAAEPEAWEGRPIRLPGRIMALRSHGKATFLDLRDHSGSIQVYLRADLMGEAYELVELLDLGDLIGVTGKLFRTRRGELTVEAAELTVLAKALRDLPEKWHGLKDVDLRYRRRYLDLLVSPEVKRTFETRSAIVRSLRRFLDERGFLEVETPVLQALYGGAHARPFETHHHALEMDLFLRIALELPLKRLIVGGFDKVYEIGRVFRNEGISTRHNPEFTMLELYWAYADYTDLMALTEALFAGLAQELHGSPRIVYQGKTLDFTPPWPRLSMVESLREKTGLDVVGIPLAELRRALIGLKLPSEPSEGRGKLIDRLFEHFVEPELWGPVFVVDHPAEISPLARVKPGEPDVALRFELYIAHREIANAFSEQNDPRVQRQRFEEQARDRADGDEEAPPLDEDFLLALEHGLPPTAGLGIGVDRLAMLFTDAPSIRDVIFFPLQRPRSEA